MAKSNTTVVTHQHSGDPAIYDLDSWEEEEVS